MTFLVAFFTQCKKNQEQPTPYKLNALNVNAPSTTPKENPFNYENIKKAVALLSNNNSNYQRFINPPNLDPNRVYTYLKFNPNTITGDILKSLENDTSIKILDFPFANGELYTEEFALDEIKAKQLADGNLYAVVKKNTTSETLLKGSIVQAIQLNELYLPQETDTTLQLQAMRQVGYSEAQLDALRICLLKRPSGFVRYLDTETGELRGVKGMQVWGLVFGVPIATYTNNAGYYNFPWRFSAGTIMGTHAKNFRVNIKPFNTQGLWEVTMQQQFIVGSLHIAGWVGACAMRNEVNFHFTEHKQNRYWAHLMDAVNLHDQYADDDGILKAPSQLLMYAHWADQDGAASAPMLGHIYFGPILLINQYLGSLVNATNLNNFPNLFSLLSVLLPDITIKTNGNVEGPNYSARLMHTVFHELGHASQFRQVGKLYWLDFITAILNTHGPNECGGGYGCGTSVNDGNVGVSESWAEFIATNYAVRLHPTGSKQSRWAGGFIQNSIALEIEPWFFNDWIASGIYNDLMDVANTDIAEDDWDRTGGLSIQQLYQAFGPDVDNFCEYQSEIINRYGLVDFEVNLIFINNRAGDCLQ